MKEFIKKYKTIYAIAVIILVWYGLYIGINASYMPSPYEATLAFLNNIDEIFFHIFKSAYRILTAIFLVLLIGIPIGLLMGFYEHFDVLLNPIIYAFYPIPKIAFLPVFMLFFGLGDESKIAVIFAIVIFQVTISMRDSVKSIKKEMFYSINSLGATKVDTIKHLIFPAIAPRLITALRICTGTAISVLFMAESYGSKYGIGYYIMERWTAFDYKNMYAGIIGISLLGIVLFKVLDLIERRFCKWAVIDASREH